MATVSRWWSSDFGKFSSDSHSTVRGVSCAAGVRLQPINEGQAYRKTKESTDKSHDSVLDSSLSFKLLSRRRVVELHDRCTDYVSKPRDACQVHILRQQATRRVSGAQTTSASHATHVTWLCPTVRHVTTSAVSIKPLISLTTGSVRTVSCMVRKLSGRVVQLTVKLLEGSHIAILVINSYMPVYVYIDCYMCTQPLVYSVYTVWSTLYTRNAYHGKGNWM